MLKLVYVNPDPARMPAPNPGFTTADLIALTRWRPADGPHGLRRLHIESGLAGTAPEDASFALLYAGQADWAEYGLTRIGADVLAWHCATGLDLGSFSTVAAALDGLCKTQPPSRRFEAATQSRQRSSLQRRA